MTDRAGAEIACRMRLWQAGLVLIGQAAILTTLSHGTVNLAVPTCIVLVLAGAVWLRLCVLIPQEDDEGFMLVAVLVIGISMRLIYLGSDPILEIDYLRYQWDGSASLAGLNPYAVAPTEATLGLAGPGWQDLANRSGGQVEAINYGHLRTIYPAVAQVFFAIAQALDPWGLLGLRLVFLAAEVVGAWLLLRLLDQIGRPRVWVAVYWCNPLIAKELINAAHMEALLVPALAATLLLILQNRPIAATIAISIAAGIKVWPLILMPFAMAGQSWRLRVVMAGLLALLVGALAIPVLQARLDAGSGFAAYASGWERNAALFGVVEDAVDAILRLADLSRTDPGSIARLLVAVVVASSALFLGWCDRPIEELFRRAAILVGLLFLLSPTGYPWYYAWVLPLLCFWPNRGLLLLGALLPVYYLRFELEARGLVDLFDTWIVWIGFGPPVAVILIDWSTGRRMP